MVEPPLRVDHNVEAYNNLIDQDGLCFTWEKSSKCFCARADGTFDLECTFCTNGWFYFDPLPVTLLVTSLLASKAFKDLAVHGDWILGKVSISSKSMNNLAFRDRITAIDSQITYSQLLFIGTREKLRYPAVEIILLRSEAKVFVSGVDYNLVNGEIIWVGGQKPADGTTVTIRFLAHPSYIVLDAMHEIRDTQVTPGNFIRMPRQHLAELDYLHDLEQPQS